MIGAIFYHRRYVCKGKTHEHFGTYSGCPRLTAWASTYQWSAGLRIWSSNLWRYQDLLIGLASIVILCGHDLFCVAAVFVARNLECEYDNYLLNFITFTQTRTVVQLLRWWLTKSKKMLRHPLLKDTCGAPVYSS